MEISPLWVRVRAPVIDYQSGSLRDDFDFGSLWCIKAQALADYIAQPDREEYQFAVSMFIRKSFLVSALIISLFARNS